MYVVLHGLGVHPALRVQLLVVVGIHVELRPHADHETSVHLVNAVQHGLGVGIARSLKLMAAPLVLGPVVPVLHNIVDGDVALAELAQRLLNLLRRLVALTALPEAQHPLGVQAGLARQGTVAADDLVEVLTADEVVIHVLRHLAPDGELAALLVAAGLCHTQTAVGLGAVGLPFYAQV